MTSQPPVRERHYLVLPQLGLAYCRVPKAANSSVRYLLARRFGFKAPEAEPNLVPNKDRFWTGQPPGVAHCLTPADFALLQAGADRPWCFSIVRNPVSRLYSAWNNKVLERRPDRPLPARLFLNSRISSDKSLCLDSVDDVLRTWARGTVSEFKPAEFEC